MTATGDRQNGRLRATWVALVLVFAVGSVGPAQAAVQDQTAAQTPDLTPAQATVLRLAEEAETLFAAGDYAGSEARLKELLPLASEIFGPGSLGISKLQVQLGDALRAQAKHAEAVTAYSTALEILESLGNQPPLEMEAIVYSRAGSRWAAGQLLEASGDYAFSANIREEVLGPRHTATAEALLNFARVELGRGRIITALQDSQRAWSIQAEVWGENSVQAMDALSVRGLAQKAYGRWSEAEEDLQRVVEFRRSLASEDEIGFANALGDLGSVLTELGRYAEAEPLHLQALEIHRRVWGPTHANVWWALNDYANSVSSRVRASEPAGSLRRIAAHGNDPSASATAEERDIRARFAIVETLRREALAIALQGHGPRSIPTGTTLANLAGVLADQGRYAESETIGREGIDIYDEVYDDNHPNLASARKNLGDTLRALGRYEEALDQHKWAGAIAQMIYGVEHAARAVFYNDVGIDQLMMGEIDVGAYSLRSATTHRMSLVCPAADRGPPSHHPWNYADPECSGHPDFTDAVATFAAARSVFENRPEASLRMIHNAGDMVIGRTRLRYATFDDARTEARRFAYVHRQFVSSAWAVADPSAQTEISEALDAFHWPYRSN